jgi:endonuclease/exonuclease/phosphatase family metal-dependent hydrolase
VQVNRSLLREFSAVIAAARWSVCLLQECPPAWARRLADASGGEACRVLTSRNQLGPLRRVMGRWSPDLIGAGEGGSNVILYRPPWRLVESRSLLLNPLRERRLGERRRLGLVRLAAGPAELCVGNVHLSTGPRPQTERELHRAAEAAVGWAGPSPLLLGGDFNVRPWATTVYGDLERRFGLRPPTAPDSIDHLLASGMRIAEPPHAWAPERREVSIAAGDGPRSLRLSDHAPVEAAFIAPRPGVP